MRGQAGLASGRQRSTAPSPRENQDIMTLASSNSAFKSPPPSAPSGFGRISSMLGGGGKSFREPPKAPTVDLGVLSESLGSAEEDARFKDIMAADHLDGDVEATRIRHLSPASRDRAQGATPGAPSQGLSKQMSMTTMMAQQTLIYRMRDEERLEAKMPVAEPTAEQAAVLSAQAAFLEEVRLAEADIAACVHAIQAGSS